MFAHSHLLDYILVISIIITIPTCTKICLYLEQNLYKVTPTATLNIQLLWLCMLSIDRHYYIWVRECLCNGSGRYEQESLSATLYMQTHGECMQDSLYCSLVVTIKIVSSIVYSKSKGLLRLCRVRPLQIALLP